MKYRMTICKDIICMLKNENTISMIEIFENKYSLYYLLHGYYHETLIGTPNRSVSRWKKLAEVY